MSFLRRHPLALVVIAGLIAGGLAVAATNAPDSSTPQDFHGRTWLTAAADRGDQLVLVNGISGLIEGRSQGGASVPEGARFIDSTATSTLVGSPDGITVVDSGTQQAKTKPGVDGEQSVLTSSLVLTVGSAARVLPKSLTGDGRPIPGAPAPVDDVAPVVDARGDGWYLGRSGKDRVAVQVTGSAPTIETHAVDRGTEQLLVVDGDVYAAGPKAIAQVDGDGSRTVAARSEVLPTVATASGDLWASATGRTITVFDGKGDGETVRTGADVVDLAVWNGAAIAATEDGAERVKGDETEPIEAVRSQAHLHADGGMLWLTSKTDVVAIDRDQQQSHFRLAAIDADLCIDSCDAGDLSKILEDQPTPTTAPKGERTTTTTTPPSDLTPPESEPELPTTTTTTTPTTTTEAPATTTTERRAPTTTAPKRPTTTAKPPATTAPQPTRPPQTVPPTRPPQTRPPQTRPPETRPPATNPPETRPPETQPPPTQPPWTRPTWTPPTNPPPPSTDPPVTTTTTTTTTTQPRVEYGLTLDLVTTGETSAEATVSVIGDRRDCAPMGVTGGTVAWSGAGSGQSQVALRWRGGDRSEPATVTIPNLQAGNLTVTFEACGVRTERTVPIQGAAPEIGPISVTPNPPPANQPFTVTAPITTPPGWTVTGGDWDGSGAGSSCTTDNATKQIDNTSAAATFQAHQAGPCRISLVVTFAPPGGGAPQQVPQEANVQIEGTKPSG